MLDLDAPIVPGQSAAGYRIGMPIDEMPQEEQALFQPRPVLDNRGQPTGQTCYASDHVYLWVDAAGSIYSIGAGNGYRGKLFGSIGLGMTIDDIERLVGPVALDEWDWLSIFGVWGFDFEIDWHPTRETPRLPGGHPDFTLPECRFAHIVSLSVNQVQKDDIFPWQEALYLVPQEAIANLPGETLNVALTYYPEAVLKRLPADALTNLSENALKAALKIHPAEALTNLPETVLRRLPEDALRQALEDWPEEFLNLPEAVLRNLPEQFRKNVLETQ